MWVFHKCPFVFFVVQTDRDGWATRRSADWDQASADLQGEINLSETSGVLTICVTRSDYATSH